MGEIWKPVFEFEELYSVSNKGNVKRNSTIGRRGTGRYARKEHLIKQRKKQHGLSFS